MNRIYRDVTLIMSAKVNVLGANNLKLSEAEDYIQW